jgi:NAD(P)-dependent dehydrogenase (short-subunit alcohol dehydrogenase family)
MNGSECTGFEGKVAVVTGGGGVLCSAVAGALAERGASVAVLDMKEDAAVSVASAVGQKGGRAMAVVADVTNRASVEAACSRVLEAYGTVDILVNGAGGNSPRATCGPSLSFFDVPQEALESVVRLNLLGTVIPCQVFGRVMAEKGSGVILNFSSINSFRPLTNIPAYSAAKAAVSNFTQWLAVHMSQNYSKEIRVNAVAPGFFLTNQNRYLLIDDAGGFTPRGQAIIGHTPMERFGEPKDLIGTILWLLSDAAKFVHGVVVPVDGGFAAFSGV